jgi:hypothetical protein
VDINKISNIEQLEILKLIYAELFVIYTCLSYYFSDIWQVYLSIALSNITHKGIWQFQLSKFAKYLASPYYIITLPPLTDDHKKFYEYLTTENSQCNLLKFHVNHTIISTPDILYQSLARNEQLIDHQLRIFDKQNERALDQQDPNPKKSRRGGKSKKKRKIKRKSKSRKYKN